MDIFDRAERLMGMSEAVWARHASPWSVYTRFSTLPLFALAVWSRTWFGGWALVLIIAAVLWIWLNPRVFRAPTYTDTWAAKGTFGERIFLNRKTVPIPDHHLRWGTILGFLSATGLPFFVYGLWAYDLLAVLLGMVLMVLPKVWFVDRMVWLYEDMKDENPEYRAWVRPRPSV